MTNMPDTSKDGKQKLRALPHTHTGPNLATSIKVVDAITNFKTTVNRAKSPVGQSMKNMIGAVGGGASGGKGGDSNMTSQEDLGRSFTLKSGQKESAARQSRGSGSGVNSNPSNNHINKIICSSTKKRSETGLQYSRMESKAASPETRQQLRVSKRSPTKGWSSEEVAKWIRGCLEQKFPGHPLVSAVTQDFLSHMIDGFTIPLLKDRDWDKLVQCIGVRIYLQKSWASFGEGRFPDPDDGPSTPNTSSSAMSPNSDSFTGGVPGLNDSMGGFRRPQTYAGPESVPRRKKSGPVGNPVIVRESSDVEDRIEILEKRMSNLSTRSEPVRKVGKVMSPLSKQTTVTFSMGNSFVEPETALSGSRGESCASLPGGSERDGDGNVQCRQPYLDASASMEAHQDEQQAIDDLQQTLLESYDIANNSAQSIQSPNSADSPVFQREMTSNVMSSQPRDSNELLQTESVETMERPPVNPPPPPPPQFPTIEASPTTTGITHSGNAGSTPPRPSNIHDTEIETVRADSMAVMAGSDTMGDGTVSSTFFRASSPVSLPPIDEDMGIRMKPQILDQGDLDSIARVDTDGSSSPQKPRSHGSKASNTRAMSITFSKEPPTVHPIQEGELQDDGPYYPHPHISVRKHTAALVRPTSTNKISYRSPQSSPANDPDRRGSSVRLVKKNSMYESFSKNIGNYREGVDPEIIEEVLDHDPEREIPTRAMFQRSQFCNTPVIDWYMVSGSKSYWSNYCKHKVLDFLKVIFLCLTVLRLTRVAHLASLVFPCLCVWACMQFEIFVNININFFFTSIVFPLSFAVNAAYTRRENALHILGNLKGCAFNLFLSHRNWQDHTPIPEDHLATIGQRVVSFFSFLRSYLSTTNEAAKDFHLGQLYCLFAEMSELGDVFRMNDLPPPLVSSVVADLRHLIVDFEKLRMVSDYRTPSSIRAFIWYTIHIVPCLCAPYFAYLNKEHETQYGYIGITLMSLLILQLNNVQRMLENPFATYATWSDQDGINLNYLDNMGNVDGEDEHQSFDTHKVDRANSMASASNKPTNHGFSFIRMPIEGRSYWGGYSPRSIPEDPEQGNIKKQTSCSPRGPPSGRYSFEEVNETTLETSKETEPLHEPHPLGMPDHRS